MGHILSIHSYRGGTGKSNLTANLAFLAAARGRRVAVLDTDLQSPGVHVVLGLEKDRITHTLSDYLFGRCELEEAAYDIGKGCGLDRGGALFLLPSSMKVEAIVRIASEGYDAAKLNQHFGRLMRDLALDWLLLDTHPGLNRETMLSTAISDTLIVVIRPDSQDFHGTAVLLEVAGRLNVPRTHMVLNKVPQSLDANDVRAKVRAAFGHDVFGLLPMSDELALLGSRGLFVRQHPQHPITRELERMAERLLAELPPAQP
jgi:MinD-like ATPase involved in chromosome partitioning or flagellar assembly